MSAMKYKDPPLFTPEAIAARVAELAATISSDYRESVPVFIAVLKGALPFSADLIRCMTIPLAVDFVRARSYKGERSTGTVEFLLEPTIDLAGRDVLVVEDILDSGVTAKEIQRYLVARGPKSLKFCTFLDKPSGRVTDVHADYIGFEIEDHFVVGYGMDLEENFRELPGIHILEHDALD